MGGTFGSSQVSPTRENLSFDKVAFVGTRGLRTDNDVSVFRFDTCLFELRSMFVRSG